MKNGSERVRYAVVGAGHIAQTAILPAFAHADESSELVAIVSSNENKRRELAARYGVAYTGGYEDLERVLEEAQADAVFITLPNHLHRAYTERAARVGVHVLCEKPMATTVADCEAMIAVTEQARVKLMIAYRLHFEEAFLTAVETVQAGDLGHPLIFTSLMSQQVRPGDIRARAEAGGGALLDLGPYPVNAARNLFRQEPVEVMGRALVGVDARFPDVETTACALLRFGGGEVATFCVSQGASGVSSYRIIGTRGDLLCEPAYDYDTERSHRLTIGDHCEEQTFPRHDQFAPELIYFSRCILDGMDPEPDGREGLADVRVLAAVMESTRTGQAVSLPPFERERRPDRSQLIVKPPVEEAQPVEAPPPTV